MKLIKKHNPGFLMFEILIMFSIFFVVATSILGFWSHIIQKIHHINVRLKALKIATLIENVLCHENSEIINSRVKDIINEYPEFNINLKDITHIHPKNLNSKFLVQLDLTYKNNLLKRKDSILSLLLCKSSKINEVNIKFKSKL